MTTPDTITLGSMVFLQDGTARYRCGGWFLFHAGGEWMALYDCERSGWRSTPGEAYGELRSRLVEVVSKAAALRRELGKV